MSNDIFEDLEKSIDDAFKPNEKERIKEKRKKHHSHSFSTHTHKLNSGGGYMRNEAYDRLMFDHNHHRKVTENQFECRGCHSKHLLLLEMPSPQVQSWQYIDGIIPHEVAMEVSTFHCSICGEIMRYYGKIIRVITEVN